MNAKSQNATKTEATTTVVNSGPSEAEVKAAAEKAKKAYEDAIAKVKAMNLGTKSAKIRALFAEGLTRSQIANYLGIRYQHVRNVLVAPMKKSTETTDAKAKSEETVAA